MKQEKRIYKDFERAEQQQRNRYKERVLKMLKNDYFDTYFITITFNDRTLNQTSEKTRLRYIKRFMIQQFKTYILNIDYGAENNREHYHATAVSKYKIICFDAWKKYGFLKAIRIYQSNTIKDTNDKATAEQLTAHAFKETTANAKIIYSRKQSNKNKDFETAINKRLDAWKDTPQAKKGAEEIRIKQLYRNKKINRKTAINLLNDLQKEP